MSIINTYILRQTMGPLLAAIAIALLVLLTERMLRVLDLVLDSQGGLTVLLQMLAFLVPHYVALALPAAFFLGVLLAFSKLHQNRELDALGSAGIGLPRLIRPVMLLAVALTVVSAANFSVGQPYARYIYRALVHDMAKAAANVYLQERTFIEVKGVTFMAERIRQSSQEFAEIFIYEEAEDGTTTAMTAERGSLNVGSSGERSTLLLSDGVRLETAKPATPEGSGQDSGFGVLKFGQFQIPIDLVPPDGFRPRGEDERELTLWELWQDRTTPPVGVNEDEMLAEFHDRLVRSFSVLFLPFLAIPFALGSRRTRQAYGIAAGLIVLVIYNQLLSIGKSLSSIGEVSPMIGLWLPFAVLALGSGYLFHRRAVVVSSGGWARLSPVGVLESLVQALRPRPGGTRRQEPE